MRCACLRVSWHVPFSLGRPTLARQLSRCPYSVVVDLRVLFTVDSLNLSFKAFIALLNSRPCSTRILTDLRNTTNNSLSISTVSQ